MAASTSSTNKRIARMILLFVLLGSITIPAKADPAATTYVVNTWQDSHDSNTGDGVCNNGAGGCSLRAAIEQADVSSSPANPVTIHFDDTGWAGLPITLNLGTMQITNSDITIDGESHTIMVDGTVNGANQDIFEISSGFITIRNLTIQNSSHRGIVLLTYPTAGVAYEVLIEGVKLVGNDDSAIFMESDIHIPVFDITIQNSLIGTTNASSTACVTSPNDQRNGSGIYLVNNVQDVTIDNVNVVCSTATGIYLIGLTYNPSNTIIRNSRIGTNGSSAMGNAVGGIAIYNTIGTQVLNNVISGNSQDGIWILYNDGAIITGNKIGMNSTGTYDVPNTQNGVSIQSGSANNHIGGYALADRNWIGGNGYNGVLITNSDSHSNLISANLIGLGIAEKAIPNGYAGVALTGGYLNTIGIADTAVPQVISNNDREGIYIENTTATMVLNSNLIGVSEDQKEAMGNGREGIKIVNASNSLITPGQVSFNGAIDSNAGTGIAVIGATAWANSIRPGIVDSNSLLPIDLGSDGPTENGSHADINGPNKWFEYPELTNRIGQVIYGRACAGCRVDIYRAILDPRQEYGGGLWVQYTMANDQGRFQATLPAGVGRVTMTASDADGNTSEMGALTIKLFLPVIRK
jgi:CSLREA domain-containing protein